MNEFETLKRMELSLDEMEAVSGGKYKPLPPKSGCFQYQIQQGDTLYRIARDFHTTVEKLISCNPHITNRNLVRAGNYMYIKA